ncbi:hypothetical protein ABT010_34165 [Streptomyces sp. NPDC002668]|uniref:hypothetical protein n=1 Tax=Streptomyces sp. NPDC002668 TaxID=3154422 RepID=UPI00332D46AC
MLGKEEIQVNQALISDPSRVQACATLGGHYEFDLAVPGIRDRMAAMVSSGHVVIRGGAGPRTPMPHQPFVGRSLRRTEW